MVTKTSTSPDSPHVVPKVNNSHPNVANLAAVVASSIPQTLPTLDEDTSWTLVDNSQSKVGIVAQQYANLERSPNFTDVTLKAWAKNQLKMEPAAREPNLNLSNCLGITDASIPTLETLVPSLKNLNLAGTRITEISPYSSLNWIDGLRLDQSIKHTPQRERLLTDYEIVDLDYDDDGDVDVKIAFASWDIALRYFSGNIGGGFVGPSSFVKRYGCPRGYELSVGWVFAGNFIPKSLPSRLEMLGEMTKAYETTHKTK